MVPFYQILYNTCPQSRPNFSVSCEFEIAHVNYTQIYLLFDRHFHKKIRSNEDDFVFWCCYKVSWAKMILSLWSTEYKITTDYHCHSKTTTNRHWFESSMLEIHYASGRAGDDSY